MKKKVPLKETYECLGMQFHSNGTQLVSDCPFCGKGEHFFLEEITGLWDCKSCGKSGNVYSFMTEISHKMHVMTHPKQWDRLSRERGGIPPITFKVAGLAWSGEEWWMPVKNEKGTVVDIRRWTGPGKALQSTRGMTNHLYGLETLAKFWGKPTKVWICEGEWDALALRWLFSMAGRTDVVVGVPGASIFKNDWMQWFKSHDVRLCYDADTPGDDGATKTASAVKQVTRKVQYLNWPDSMPIGWDIRDFVLEGAGRSITAQAGIVTLEGLLRSSPRHPKAQVSFPEKEPASPEPPKENPFSGKKVSFPNLMKVFSKWLRIDVDFQNALAVALATCLANEVPGDPIWMYIVAPPGSGKTVILTALQASDRVFYRSTMTPASLVSGFQANPDPSLLPQMDGKTAVFKDGTELLTMHSDARREIYGVLRGAFDGQVSKSFGNGVQRHYLVHFNMLIGITSAVHGDLQATMGERFLKFEMREKNDTTTFKIKRAIENIAKEVQMEEELSAVCTAFLERTIPFDNLPRIPPRYVERIVSLAQLLAMLRAQVDRETFGDREIMYRPTHEIGTRIAKQIAKLGQMLVQVYDKTEIDDEVYRMLERVAMDTMIGFHLDIVRVLMAVYPGILTREEIARRATMSSTSTVRKLNDMLAIGIIEKTTISGEKSVPAWKTSKAFSELWRSAAIGKSFN